MDWSCFHLSVEKKLASHGFFKTRATYFFAFSRALRQLRAIALSFDWFAVLFVTFVIGSK